MADCKRKTANLFFKKLEGANISDSGVITTLTGFDLYIAAVEQGTRYSGSGYIYAFFENEPTIGSISYDSSRSVNSLINVVSPINGYVAVRNTNTAQNVMCNIGNTILPYEPPGWIHSLRELGTATDTLSLPATIYADGNNTTATIYGNLVQSGQPSAVVVNIYPPIDNNSINKEYWGEWYDYERYLPDEPCYNRSGTWSGLGNEIYLDVGTYTFSAYIKAEAALEDAAVCMYIGETSGNPHGNEPATASATSQLTPPVTTTYQRCSFTFEVTAAGYIFPRIEKRVDSGTNIIVTCWQLERGSTATPYIAYGKSVISPIYPSETGDRTRNLVNSDTYYGSYKQSDGTYQTTRNNLYDVKIKPFTSADIGKTFTFVANISPTTGNTRLSANINGTVINGSFAEKSVLTFTVETINDSIFFNYGSGTSTVTTLSQIMLVEGSTAPSSYIPYGYKLPVQCGGVTTPVYTAEPLRKIGDYTDYKSNSAEYRAIKKLVLTGQENWTLNNSGTANAYLSLSTGAAVMGSTEQLCTHYQYNTITSSNTNKGLYMTQSGVLRVREEEPTQSDKTTFESFLQTQYAAGTPVTVWYVLATPTTESITAPEIPTTAGSQTFDVDTTLKPSKVELTYKGWHSHNPKEYSGGSWN